MTVANSIKEFAGIYCLNNDKNDAASRASAYLNYFEKFDGERTALDSASFYLNRKDQNLLNDELIHLKYLSHDDASVVSSMKNIDPSTIKDPWTNYRIGQCYQNSGDVAGSIRWYKRANSLAPENTDFINKLGAALIETNQLIEGIALLEKSLKLNPKQPEALTNLGFGKLRRGDAKEAMQEYDKALRLDPDFEQALLNKAAVFNMMGDKVNAKKLLLRILKREPSNDYVKSLMGKI